MVTPDEEHDQFLKDPRTSCKYGNQCYQKNPQHLQKYKHPPKKRPVADLKEKQLVGNTPKRPKVLDKDDHKGFNGVKDVAHCKPEDNIETSDSLKEWTERVRPLNYLSDSCSDDSTEESVPTDHSKVSDELCSIESKASTSTNTSPHKDCTKTDTSHFSEENVIAHKTSHSEDKPKKFSTEQFIFDKFLVKMPPDFYAFWDYCATVKPDNPSEAFANIGLHLVGPYDVCSGKFSKHAEKSPNQYLIHWRYFYDPPEFQTVIKGSDATGYHIGYFRDDPNELPAFVGCNHARTNGEITIMGDNIFAAVSKYLETTLKTCDPFKKMNLTRVLSQIKAKATVLNLNLSESSERIKERNKKVLSSTFNKAGLVVPYNKKTQLGYRHLYMSNKELRVLLDRVATASEQKRSQVLSELQPALTAASIATDECDFGTGLELGWNILAHGVDSLNATIEQYLNTAYGLLNRSAFAKITSAHMANRKNGVNLSVL